MDKSIADRKKQFLEDCCGGGPTMSMGDAGYQADAPAAGPVAGYDPMLGKKKKKDVVGMAKRLRKEGYKYPDLSNHKSVIDKIRDKGGDEDREDRIHDSIDRMRDDPQEMRKSGRGKERQNRMSGKKKGYTKDISVMSKNSEE
jgi:hypothetical protein